MDFEDKFPEAANGFKRRSFSRPSNGPTDDQAILESFLKYRQLYQTRFEAAAAPSFPKCPEIQKLSSECPEGYCEKLKYIIDLLNDNPDIKLGDGIANYEPKDLASFAERVITNLRLLVLYSISAIFTIWAITKYLL